MMLSRTGFPRFLMFAVLFVLTIGVLFSSGQTFNLTPGSFSSTNVCANSASPAPGCQILTNGDPTAPSVVSGGVLRLNSATQNQHASAWFFTRQPLSTGFTTSFQFQMSNTGMCDGCSFPADGFALVIQNDPAGTGALGYTGNGQNMSYGNNDDPQASGPGNSIRNSLAVELDTFLNTDFGDPDANHIAVQSCGPNSGDSLAANSADHNYLCPNGKVAKLALQSLPVGTVLTDGKVHTITVNYTAPGSCTENCNNFAIFLDSSLILQTTLDIAQQLSLQSAADATGAYIGFTSATGALVQNNDIISWSFSELPLEPITITQPLQTTSTDFNYTQNLTASVDYSQSGLPASSFNGIFMQGTAEAITDQQFANLVQNTPFQGSTCLHQNVGSPGSPLYVCVVTSDLCTKPGNSIPAGANCPNTGTSALIGAPNTFGADPAQKPIIAPAYAMAKDTALNCPAESDNTCKGLLNIFESIVGDPVLTGRTKDFNSLLIPMQGTVQPQTSVTTNPALNQGWTNGNVVVTLNGTEIVPSNNTNPPASMPTVTGIQYSYQGANAPSPINGSISGPSGSFTLPGTVEGLTTITFQAQDSSATNEVVVTNNAGQVSTSLPTFDVRVDRTPPTFNCVPPVVAWQAGDVVVPCTASDAAGGSGLATPSVFSLVTAVPVGTETNAAQTSSAIVADIAGNQVSTGTYGPFMVDKKAPVIAGPTLSVKAPTLGQAVTASFSCADGGSGVVRCGPTGSPTIPPTGNTGTLMASVDTSTPGPHSFSVLSQDAVGNQATPSTVSYVVSAPGISISPSNVNFGTVLFGTVWARVIIVTNTGTSPLKISSLKIVPVTSDKDDYGQLNNCGSPIAPGGSCVIALGFLADDLGVRSANIVLTDNAPGSPHQVPLTANVVKKK